MLETVWFALWGLLWTIYFILDGFDLGLGAWLPFLARNDTERRIFFNAMGPFWDGNEVWLVTAGGVTFAAFPGTYAVMFSSLYTPLMVLLFALILRGISFEFRSKETARWWRNTWDGCLWVGSWVSALLLGVAFANIFRGIPIDHEGVFHGTFLTLLHPYGCLGGILFLLLFLHHGAIWLYLKSTGEIQERARKAALSVWPILLLMILGFMVFTATSTDLYRNLLRFPLLFVFPGISLFGFITCFPLLRAGRAVGSWIASAAGIGGLSLFGFTGLYPRLLPSSLNPAYSRTAFNTQSSDLTLTIMLGVTLTVVPIVIGYQTWVYRRFSGPVDPKEFLTDEAY